MAIPSAPTNHILTHWARLSIWKSRPETTRRCVRFMFTICVVSWKSAICHERNADRLDFQLITNCYRLGTLQNTASLSHVSGWSWNATPFWQPKIQSSNGVHHVDAPVLYGNSPYFDRKALFNRVNPDRTTACDTIRRADGYQNISNRQIDVPTYISRQNHTSLVCINYLRYFTLIKSSPFSICVLLVKDW